MYRNANVLHTRVDQSIQEIGEAKNMYQRSKRDHQSASASVNGQCARLQQYKKIAKQCRMATAKCQQRQAGLSHLVKKRNQLRAELDALNASQGRLNTLQKVLDDQDFAWEGEYVGRGGMRVHVTDEDAGFRLSSSSGSGGEFAVGILGEALRFCFDATKPETCGTVVLDDESGFTFNGEKFKKI